MKYLRDYRVLAESAGDADPMEGVANLFDTAVVFIAALLVALMTVFDAGTLFDRDSQVTIMTRKASGEVEIIEKRGRQFKAVKMSREEASGKGVRLGTAYQLEDGSMIYVPEQ